MKVKSIKKRLRKEFDAFVESITCEKTRKLVEKNSIITGGSIASMLLGEPVNDFDIYFVDIETTLAVARYYFGMIPAEHKDEGDCIRILEKYDKGKDGEEKDRVEIFIKSSGMWAARKEDLENSEDYTVKIMTSNAITLTNKIQLIVRFYGTPEEIHENFDFVHAFCYWTSSNNKLVLNKDSLVCILTKELRYRGSKYPLASIFRAKKFILRGFTINAGQYLKMALQLNQLDLTNLSVLKEQLVGVDLVFFESIINSIPEEKNIDGKIDEKYLISIVDKVFDA